MTVPGSWPSPLSAAAVTAAGRSVTQVAYAPDGTPWWAESRPDEGGRTVLVTAAGVQVPDGFDARTAFHEYGGRCWLPLSGGRVVSTDMRDQRLWLLGPGQDPQPLTAGTGGRDRWCLPVEAPTGLLCLRERLDGPGRRVPSGELVLVPWDGAEPVVLWEGSDFVDAPALSPDGARLAFLTWDHPRMPWDGTELRVAAYDGERLGPVEVVLGGPGESVLQPGWDGEDLLAVSDASGWWNLVRLRGGSRGPEPVWTVQQECGGPSWESGYRWYATLPGGRVAVLHGRSDQRLSVLARDGAPVLLDVPPVWEPALATVGDLVLGLAGGPDEPVGVVEVDTATGTWRRLAGPARPDPAWVPQPELVEVPSSDRTTHARLFPPTSPQHTADGPVPYVLMVHGGPTSQSAGGYDVRRAFWTSRGFGVADVDHGGSTGHGRAYRDLLRGRWGVVEVDDCEAVARWLLGTGRASAVVIRGGSAGGWTVLSALTRGDSVFAAGTSYYGVADLAELAATTHDFESRYLDGLVPLQEQQARSPLTHLDRLDRPLLVLQGREDKVVPPSQAEALLAALARRGVPHAALFFAGEGHGFRRAENQVAALEAELSFYGQVLGFAPPGVPVLPLR